MKLSVAENRIQSRWFPIFLTVLSVFLCHCSADAAELVTSLNTVAVAHTWRWWHILLVAFAGGSLTSVIFFLYVRRLAAKREELLINERFPEERVSEMQTILKMSASSMEQMAAEENNPEHVRVRIAAMLVGCRRMQELLADDGNDGGSVQTEEKPQPKEADIKEADMEAADSLENDVEATTEEDEIQGPAVPDNVTEESEAVNGNTANTPNKPDNPNYGFVMTRDEDFLARFDRIVKENLFDSEFSAEDIAKRLNMSRSTVYRRVKRITDMSIVDYIRSLRLKQSRIMLEEGHGVSETAFACGFGDAGYFSVTFKKEYGISPTQFKKKFEKSRT